MKRLTELEKAIEAYAALSTQEQQTFLTAIQLQGRLGFGTVEHRPVGRPRGSKSKPAEAAPVLDAGELQRQRQEVR